jgi:hypothetical protein
MRPWRTFPPITECVQWPHASGNGVRKGIVEEPGSAGQMEPHPDALSRSEQLQGYPLYNIKYHMSISCSRTREAVFA